MRNQFFRLLSNLLLTPLLLISTFTSVTAGPLDNSRDYHSFANPQEIRVTHLDLDLKVDFKQRRLSGSVVHHIQRSADSQTLVLDTRNLDIQSVQQRSDDQWLTAPFVLGEPAGVLGRSLSIELADGVTEVKITYQSGDDAGGLDWLAPEQTAGKRQPFLYTQAQAIHARSFIPLQDSPAVRVTYSARIHTPKALRAVMSAANDPDAELDGVFEFDMPQPIPSYLIALGVGDLKFQAIGERTGVYAEPEILKAAAREFEDTQSMLEAVERRYGSYDWDRYDLLILPPSFPWGGMENPRLSFITPTVIAGDKSLVALIAHELAHSWSGNAVTNATWRDIWLNEGFTTYLTYRIMEDVYGPERANMERVLGYQDLLGDFPDLEPADQHLTPDLRDRDPDAAFSNVPYEKGALFVSELEARVGREAFDGFLRDYFGHFAFQSITTDQFLDYVGQTLIAEHPEKVSLERMLQWIEQPGIPEGAVLPQSDVFSQLDELHRAWLNSELKTSDIDTDGWSVHQWLYFLNNLPDELSQKQMRMLDNSFGLTKSTNNEILHSWLLMAIRNHYQPADTRLNQYLTSIGRRKLIVPLYRALIEQEGGRERAQAIYRQASPGYHVVARNTIQKLFENPSD